MDEGSYPTTSATKPSDSEMVDSRTVPAAGAASLPGDSSVSSISTGGNDKGSYILSGFRTHPCSEQDRDSVSVTEAMRSVAKAILRETEIRVSSRSQSLQGTNMILQKLACVLVRGSLTQIDLSQRGLVVADARIIRLALLHNPSLSVLKLGYNNLADNGTSDIAQAIRGHPSLTTLDIGFNNVGDVGCTALATNAVAGNATLRTLYLSGNAVGEKGVVELAASLKLGSGLICLHLTGNKIGENGVKSLMRAIGESEERAQQEVAAASVSASENNVNETNSYYKTNNRVGGSCNGNNCRLQQLFVGGTAMGSAGCLSISNMLLTNLSLRVLSLSDNGIEDRDMALFSQSISRNKLVPLEVLQLSFNRLTCVGVESLMNAVWGSTTLRELRLDNNRVQDRGAQLVAVVLTSVNLEVVDLGFNVITTVGVKALMKSLAENDHLQSLTLSGNPLDTNASKAVSYALAYNTSLRKLYVDHCSVGYAAQRHITAGIASNSLSALQIVTGFRIGAIAVSLGLPPSMEHWSNDQVLSFFRTMWERWRRERGLGEFGQQTGPGASNPSLINLARQRSRHDDGSMSESKSADNILINGQNNKASTRVGPSDPATVVSAAKSAFEALGNGSLNIPLSQHSERNVSLESPLASVNSIMIERTESGNLRVPLMENLQLENVTCRTPSPRNLTYYDKPPISNGTFNTKHNMIPSQSLTSNSRGQHDPARRQRNMNWLNQHMHAINELAQQPFDNADLWKLHQHFFSPVDPTPVQAKSNGSCHHYQHSNGDRSFSSGQRYALTAELSTRLPQSDTTLGNANSSPALERKMSYRFLNDAVSISNESKRNEMIRQQSSSSPLGRRRYEKINENGEGRVMQPASKRAKKARIAYYPRIKEKLEYYRSKASQHQALILMRQLKYIESMLFQGLNIYSDNVGCSEPERLSPSDAEAILIDML